MSMTCFIFIFWGLLALLLGFAALASEKGAVHQILGGKGLLIATLSFGFAALINLIDDIKRQRDRE